MILVDYKKIFICDSRVAFATENFVLGGKELLQEKRRFTRSLAASDKCCQGPNIVSCSLYEVSGDVIGSETEISVHGYQLQFTRKVEPHGFVYKNIAGDEAVLSVRKHLKKRIKLIKRLVLIH